MDSDGSVAHDRDLREGVRFYLLDHRTGLGKTIDIALLVLNLVFVCLFVVETYPVADQYRSLLWSLEVGIAAVFLVEYVLRLYGARDRWAEFRNGYTMVDLLAILPTLSVLVLPVGFGALNIGFIRVIRVVRVLRFYRRNRPSASGSSENLRFSGSRESSILERLAPEGEGRALQ
jgi:voltage-gated potassium channel